MLLLSHCLLLTSVVIALSMYNWVWTTFIQFTTYSTWFTRSYHSPWAPLLKYLGLSMGRVGWILPNSQRTSTRSGGWFSNPQLTRNSNKFVGLGCQWMVVGLGETNNHWNLLKHGEISPNPSKIQWDLIKSNEIFTKSCGEIIGLAKSIVYCARNWWI